MVVIHWFQPGGLTTPPPNPCAHRYYYRFTCGEYKSPIGRTKTFTRGELDELIFAAVSCANWGARWGRADQGFCFTPFAGRVGRPACHSAAPATGKRSPRSDARPWASAPVPQLLSQQPGAGFGYFHVYKEIAKVDNLDFVVQGGEEGAPGQGHAARPCS